MSNSKNRYTDALTNLVILTQKSKISWNISNREIIASSDFPNNIGTAYETLYKEKILRIYKRSYMSTMTPMEKQIEQLAWPTGLMALAKNNKDDRKVWRTSYKLEVISDDGKTLWQFPPEDITKDLYEAIQYKTSGASDIIDSLLDEET